MSRKLGRVVAAGTVAFAGALAGGTAAVAAPVETKDSSAFTYRYEMDVAPSTQDLDGNGTNDWRGGEVLWRMDRDGHLGRATVTGPFTMEVRVRIAETPAVSDAGAFGVVIGQPGQGESLRFNVGDDGVGFDATTAIATGSNTDDYHVYRIAYEGNNRFWVWRDGEAIHTDDDTPVVGSNGTLADDLGLWFVGTFSGSQTGEWDLNYIRVTPGVYAPIPEPAAVSLIGLGCVVAMGRRRA